MAFAEIDEWELPSSNASDVESHSLFDEYPGCRSFLESVHLECVAQLSRIRRIASLRGYASFLTEKMLYESALTIDSVRQTLDSMLLQLSEEHDVHAVISAWFRFTTFVLERFREAFRVPPEHPNAILSEFLLAVWLCVVTGGGAFTSDVRKWVRSVAPHVTLSLPYGIDFFPVYEETGPYHEMHGQPIATYNATAHQGIPVFE